MQLPNVESILWHFRFGTAGEYKGKRERLSEALLSRFLHVTFHELPPEEWLLVLEGKLGGIGLAPQLASSCAQAMLRVHMAMRDEATATTSPFPEVW